MMITQTSVSEFLAFASNADYLAGVGHRTADLEDSLLLPVVKSSPPTESAAKPAT